jgi:hypothetical protein
VLYTDSESIGLVGPMMTVQHAPEDGDVSVEHVFGQPARKTLHTLERLADEGYVAFNLAFEAFQFQRTYCVLRLLDPSRIPTPESWLSVERAARFGPCLKPRHVLDLWLVAKRGPAQSMMDRKDIYVRRVPEVLAPALAEELKSRISLSPAYFSRRADGYQWHVVPDPDAPEWCDVVLRWGASSGLGALCAHLGVGEKLEMEIDHPDQHEYDPCRAANWLPHFERHRDFWLKAGDAYARRDVELLRGLRKALGNPQPDDDDSVLAASVGSCRWRGWSILRAEAEDAYTRAQVRAQAVSTAPLAVKAELVKLAGPMRGIAIKDTRDETLEQVQGWGGEVGEHARLVRDARSAEKEADYVGKLLRAERAHFDFSVIGTLSGRMAGRGGVSGHQAPASLRGIFDLASPGLSLDGGDFDSFEPSILAAACEDAALTEMLKLGKKIHGIYGSTVLDEDYDDVKGNEELYKRSKVGFLARLYGAHDAKTAEVFGLPVDTFAERDAEFLAQFKGVGAEKKRVHGKFCSMKQATPGGRVEWFEPADYEESLLGFRRYFTLENKLCRTLFELASNVPQAWKSLEGRVSRRKGKIQTPGGAIMSALFAAAFNVQARNLRQAGNHRIQSTGAEICKRMQRRIWDHQPAGVHEWVVQPFQIHDELEVARRPDLDLTPTVASVVDHYRAKIPLLGMSWKRNMSSWKEKG